MNLLTFQVARAVGVDVPATLDGVSQSTIGGWKQTIRQAVENPQSLSEATGLFADIYRLVYGWITQQVPVVTDPSGPPPTQTTVDAPMDGVNKSAWVFIRAVADINGDSANSPQNVAAREYTRIQWRLRTGAQATDGLISRMSNGIALSVMNAIINGGPGSPERPAGVIPGIDEIGRRDASVVIDSYFNRDPGGWVGNALFHFFGTDQFFKNGLLPDGPRRAADGGPDNGPDPNGTYDIFASAYALQQTLKGLSSADLISYFLNDSRAFVMANNDIGTAGTEALMQNLSAELDSEIRSRYYENWSGLFNTFWNPSALNNSLLRPAPQVVVGMLNENDTLDLRQPDPAQGIPNVVDR